MREICMLRSTRRGLETWHGRDGVTIADEKAAEIRPSPARQSSTLPDERDVETEPWLNH